MGTTTFVWDPVFDCVTHELDENNVVKAVYHNEPQQYGGVLSQRRGTTSHFHHHDALGSMRFLTDSSGNVTDTYLHDAWGNLVASTGTTVNPFKWVGKYGYYTDQSTGLVYVRARIYMPTVARWESLDPLSFVDGPNLFVYGYLRPPVLTDPGGQVVIMVGFEGTGAFVGLSDKDIQDSYVPIAQDVLQSDLAYQTLPQVVFGLGSGRGKAEGYAQKLKMDVESKDPLCGCCYQRSVLIGFSYGALTAIWVLEALQKISTAKIDLVFLIDVVANNPWKAGNRLQVNANNYCRMVNVWQDSANGGVVDFQGTEVAGANVNRRFTGSDVDSGPFNPDVPSSLRKASRRHPNLPKLIAVQDMFRHELQLLEAYGTSKERPETCGVDDVCGNCSRPTF